MNFFAPFFKFASGLPDMLPERSKTRMISVGLVKIFGSAVKESLTLNVPPQSMLETFNSLFELVIPIELTYPF